METGSLEGWECFDGEVWLNFPDRKTLTQYLKEQELAEEFTGN